MAEILVVDDERVIREGLKRMLLAEGFSVRTAKNGDEALAAFRDRRPALVLLDVMMPKRNGFSVCGEIRSIDPFTPIVFLTAKDGESEQVRGFGLGADDYISKSASDAELLARVRRAVERVAVYNTRPEAAESRRRQIGSAMVDFDTLVVQNGDEVERLTKTEADLLWLLVVERDKPVPCDNDRTCQEDDLLAEDISDLCRRQQTDHRYDEVDAGHPPQLVFAAAEIGLYGAQCEIEHTPRKGIDEYCET